MGKTRFLFSFLSFLLISSGVLALACNEASRQVHVPAAIEGQAGGLLSIVAQISPGNGSVFTTVHPNVGMSTQASQYLASIEGLAKTSYNFSQCEIKFIIIDTGSRSVDGPSAGLAMGVAVRAAAEGKQIRDDVAITGAIGEGGVALEVGGLIDKAQAAARNGMHIFITPKQRIYENIILQSLSEKYNFTVIEVESLDKAYEIATSPAGKKFESTFKLEVEQIPENLKKRKMSWQEEKFGKISSRINLGLEQKLKDASGPLAEYKEHFEREVKRNNEILGLGYAYTAANYAFLSLVDAEFLSTPPESLKVGPAANEIEKCLETLQRPQVTKENFEFVMGGAVREEWARQKMQDILEREKPFAYSEERYQAVRELYYAKSWCLASGQLYLVANEIGGTPIDVGKWEKRAKAEVALLNETINNSQIPDFEAQWHLKVAQNSIGKGDWLAAIFDSAYGQAMQKSLDMEIGGLQNSTQGQMMESIGIERQTLWGRLYHSQVIYMQAKGNLSFIAPGNIRVLRLSDEIEARALSMRESLESNRQEVVFGHYGGANTVQALAASILIVLFVALIAQIAKK